jgi:bifunctional DNase/RNase
MRLRYRHRKILKICGIFVAIFIFGILMVIFGMDTGETQKISEDNEKFVFDSDPLDLAGYVSVKIGISPGKMYFVDNCTALMMITSKGKTFTIQRGVTDIIDFRPDPYDLFYDVMNTYDVNVRFVKIYRLEDGVYYARLFVEKDNKILSLDSKPSDAVALSTRFNSPIYVHEGLLRDYGENVC